MNEMEQNEIAVLGEKCGSIFDSVAVIWVTSECPRYAILPWKVDPLTKYKHQTKSLRIQQIIGVGCMWIGLDPSQDGLDFDLITGTPSTSLFAAWDSFETEKGIEDGP